MERMQHEQLVEILTSIQKGLLPRPNPVSCRQQALRYDSEKAFKDFCTKLKEIYSWKQNRIGEKFSSAYLYENDRITVIIIADNHERFIAETIDSVLNQSFPREFLEIILWDNASEDGTSEILKEYESNYPDNVILVRSNERMAAADARNAAMDYMRGNFVSFAEPGDIMEPDFLDALYCKIKLFNSEYAGCACREDISLAVDSSLEKDSLFHLETEAEKEEYRSFLGGKDSVRGHVFFSAFLSQNNIRFSEDKYDFFAQCISYGKRAYEMKDKLYYRKDNGAINL